MKPGTFAILFLALFSSLLFACKQNSTYTPKLKNYPLSIPEITGRDSLEKSQTHLLIEKSEYRLSLFEGDSLVKQYPCVFGFNPADDKRMEGDGCTPEGEFKLRSIYPHKKWSRFMWVDYPTEESYAKHNASKAAGEIPENASIGGEIGIHGVPAGLGPMVDLKDNWTLGCISLKNEDVIEVYDQVEVGTRVVIRK